MSVEILYDPRGYEAESFACFFCNTSMRPFGPVFTASEGWDAQQVAAAFEAFCHTAGLPDLRKVVADILENAYEEFLVGVLPNFDLMLAFVEASY
jgi:hypothetical protein